MKRRIIEILGSVPGSLRDKLQGHGGLLLIFVAWIYLFTYSASLKNPNERPRVLQARAMVEYGQLHIGETHKRRGGKFKVRELYGGNYRGVNDVALMCTDASKKPPKCAGKLYPAKAPGASLMGAPVLFLASTLGLVPEGKKGEVRATWILRYGGVALPMFLVLLLFAHWLSVMGVPGNIRLPVLIATGLGTGLFPYSIMFVGHATAGAAIFLGCWCMSRAYQDEDGQFRWALAGGAATSAAVLLEYHAFIAACCVAVWVLFERVHRKGLAGFAVGSLSGLAVFMFFHNHVFLHPLRTGHSFLMTKHNRIHQARGFLGLEGLSVESLVAHLFDTYMGLLPLMPWLVLGIALGAKEVWRSDSAPNLRGMNRVLMASCVAYLFFVTLLGPYRAMNGWSIGPRYLVPVMLPMAAIAAVGWWRCVRDGRYRLSSLCSGLAAASVVIMATLTVAFPQPPSSARSPFGELAIPMLMEGWGVRNLGWYAGLGAASLWIFAGIIAVGVCAILWAPSGSAQAPRQKWESRGLAGLLFCGWLLALAAYAPSDNAKLLKAHKFVRDRVEGVSPPKAPPSASEHPRRK